MYRHTCFYIHVLSLSHSNDIDDKSSLMFAYDLTFPYRSGKVVACHHFTEESFYKNFNAMASPTGYIKLKLKNNVQFTPL